MSASTTEPTYSDITDVAAPQDTAALQHRPKQQQHQQQQQPDLPRDLPEYKAAIELEIWKEQQEEAFKNIVRKLCIYSVGSSISSIYSYISSEKFLLVFQNLFCRSSYLKTRIINISHTLFL